MTNCSRVFSSDECRFSSLRLGVVAGCFGCLALALIKRRELLSHLLDFELGIGSCLDALPAGNGEWGRIVSVAVYGPEQPCDRMCVRPFVSCLSLSLSSAKSSLHKPRLALLVLSFFFPSRLSILPSTPPPTFAFVSFSGKHAPSLISLYLISSFSTPPSSLISRKSLFAGSKRISFCKSNSSFTYILHATTTTTGD